MQGAQHQCAVEIFLLWKPSDVDGLKARERLPRVFEIIGNCLVGEIAQAIVVAIVSNLGGKFRLGAQRVLPLIGEQTIEFVSSRFERRLGSRGEEWDQSERDRNHHERSLQADLQNVCVDEDTSSEKYQKRALCRDARGEDLAMERIGAC